MELGDRPAFPWERVSPSSMGKYSLLASLDLEIDVFLRLWGVCCRESLLGAVLLRLFKCPSPQLQETSRG